MMLVLWFQAPLQLRLNIFFSPITSFLTFLEPLENSEIIQKLEQFFAPKGTSLSLPWKTGSS